MQIIYFISIVFLISITQIKGHDIRFLKQGESFSHTRNTPPFSIYCYAGKPKYIIHIWQSVILQIDHPSNDYTRFDGTSPEAVEKEYIENHSSWSVSLFSWKQKQLKLEPFNQSCIGIYSKEPYTVHLNVIRIDYWKVLLLITGLLLFSSADKLSHNHVFYYLCGVSLGICTSFLILIYFISKLFPKKPIMYGVAACGWTIGIYILQLLWDNIRLILTNYTNYLCWYIVVTGVISFIICYRFGPIENERSKNLMRWNLQLFGLAAIFFSTHFQEAAMAQIVILLICYNIPSEWLIKSKKYWKTKFPPKVKLLTNDEYYEQGVKETSKALKELREYCTSPKCNQWKTALKLKDVKRFASFIEGNSHLSDEEILEYETSIQETYLTDDEDEKDIFTEEDD